MDETTDSDCNRDEEITFRRPSKSRSRATDTQQPEEQNWEQRFAGLEKQIGQLMEVLSKSLPSTRLPENSQSQQPKGTEASDSQIRQASCPLPKCPSYNVGSELAQSSPCNPVVHPNNHGVNEPILGVSTWTPHGQTSSSAGSSDFVPESIPSSGQEGDAWNRVSSGLLQTLIPNSFTGEYDANPVVFMKQFARMAKLQPFTRSQFSMLVHTVLLGRAATWFQSIETEIQSPDHFMLKFREEFASKDYLCNLKYKINRERQQDGESIVAYTDRMCQLYAQLPDVTPDTTIIETILMGVNREAALQLSHHEFQSIGTLRAKAYRLDTLMRPNHNRPGARAGIGRASAEATFPDVRVQPVRRSAAGAIFSGRTGQNSTASNAFRVTEKSKPFNISRIRCYKCNSLGHYQNQCSEAQPGNANGVVGLDTGDANQN